MNNIPIYKNPDNTYTFLDNGTVPTPLHLLKPDLAFCLSENIPQELRDHFGLSFTDMRGDGSFVMLYTDMFDPICARLKDSDGNYTYHLPKGALETLTTREKLESGAMTLKEHIIEQIGGNTTPEQAAENMRKFKLLVGILQQIASRCPKIEFYAVPPSKDRSSGEAGFTYEDEASFFEDDLHLFAQALEQAESFDLEHSEVEGQHRAYFIVGNCYTWKQQQEMKEGE